MTEQGARPTGILKALWREIEFFFRARLNTSTQTGLMCIEQATSRGSVRYCIRGWGVHCESPTVSFGKTVSILAIKVAIYFLFFF